MKVTNAIAHVLKKEGVDALIGYPVNPIIEGAAEADIRTIMVRQERIGLHMCDAIGKLTSGEKIGVFVMQHGPGTENAFGGVAQAYGDSCPVVVLPAGYARDIRPGPAQLQRRAQFPARHQVGRAGDGRATPRSRRCAAPSPRCATAAPARCWSSSRPTSCARRCRTRWSTNTRKAPRLQSGPDPRSVSTDAPRRWWRPSGRSSTRGRGCITARPGRSCGSWPKLLEAPVTTTLPGKSAFPENHPLSLGSGGIGIGAHLWHLPAERRLHLRHRLQLYRTSFGTPMPKGKKIAHATLDPTDINKDVPVDLARSATPG